ncbi:MULTISPECIES: DUF554 domain-containing protein [Enterococcus]|uniref:Transport protein n=1 Tax=Enterococcus sulfureus ATCC 49903 TaxID=1140003 RepID=S0L8B4_9ENTE|nr:DUF554 domain-containing protein [Enterococcus sulfureus]EOT48588.1 hypothetical protein OMY_00543 [Enterococcus sulfureus ATCC 49903]EOT87480.1 hypothetical protein I573_00536 [Enterococcus sulfureus ATCC 49903]
MLGTVFNTTMIIIGSLVGGFLKERFPKRLQESLLTTMGLVAVLIGIETFVTNQAKSEFHVLFILSLAIGTVIGEGLKLQQRVDQHLGQKTGSDFASGFVTAMLLFCIGTLSIVGPIQAATTHEYTFLLINGVLDGITSIVLSATFGLGIIWVAPILFGWQSLFYIVGLVLQNTIPENLLTEIMIVGGVLIFASGLSMLNIKKIQTLNLLPALVIPILVFICFGRWM